MAAKKYRTVMLIDDNEIDNLINQKMIEAAAIAVSISGRIWKALCKHKKIL